MKDDISEATWAEVSEWLSMRGLVLNLRLECRAFVAEIGLRGPDGKLRRWWLATGRHASEALARVLSRCKATGGDALLIEQAAASRQYASATDLEESYHG